MAKTNKGRKFFATTATAALVASAIVPVASAAQVNDYNSIASYAQEAVQDLVDRGVVQGDANGNFQPRKSVSRAEAATILTGALGLTTSDNVYFKDVKSGAWYYDAINAAVNNGVFSGKGAGIFEPNGNLTRGEAAIILVNAFNLEGRASLAQFSDEKSVKAWAVESLEIAVGNGVIKGENGKIKANDAITKQDFAVMFSRAEAAAEAVSAHSVKVINATTVEVTFPEAVTDASKLNIAIDGLTISNRAVKQSNNKTVVLTTSAQEAGKEYTVTVDGDAVGKFTGVAQVIPTAVNIVEKSLQAQVGTEVTLKAQVTVAEGQSKANIPVTFNIVNNASIGTATLNQPIVVEALTDENGVATHTYTRYAQTSLQIASYDEVQAYATGDATKRSFSKVYWANIKPLSLTEVTPGNDIQNGGKKVYRVTAALNHVETITEAQYRADVAGYNAKGVYSAGQYVNVGYKENTNVTPDQAKKKVDVIDAAGRNLGYPGQYLTSTSGANNPTTNNWVKEIKVKLDASGEAIFTLSGLDEAVTPFVFVDQTNTLFNAKETIGRFEATELFAEAPTVKFAKIHSLITTLTPVGEQYAASFYNNDTDRIANNLEGYLGRTLTVNELKAAVVDAGGRDYKLTVTDKAGKLAPQGTKVGLDVAIGSPFRTDGGAVYLVDNNTRTITKLTGDATKGNSLTEAQKLNLLTTDAKGEVSFTLIGYKDAYATPEVIINSGNDQSKIDANDQKLKGEIVYFSDARVSKSVLSVNKAQAAADERDFVEFVYQTVDQNGKPYRPSINNLDLNNDNNPDNYVPVSFEVSTVFNEVRVTPGEFGLNKRFENLTGANQTSVTVGPDSMGNHVGGSLQYRSLVVVSDEFGRASVKVYGIGGRETNVNVTASTTLSSLPQLLTASAQLIGNSLVPATYEGIVTGFNPATNSLTFAGKDAISYTNSTFFNGTTQVTEQEFEKVLNDAFGTVVVKRELTATGNKFTIVSVSNTGSAPVNESGNADAIATNALNAAVKAAEGLVEGSYSAATWTKLQNALALPDVTTEQKVAKTNAINTAIDALQKVVNVTVTEAVAAGNFEVVGTGVVGKIAPAAGETAVITLDAGKSLPTTATFEAKIGDKEYTVTYADNKYTVAPKETDDVQVNTIGSYNVGIYDNRFGSKTFTIKQADLTGDLAGSTTLTATISGQKYVGELIDGGFTFAVPVATEDSAINAGTLAK